MTAIFVTPHPLGAQIRFKYDPRAVEIIKGSVPPSARTWDADLKVWTVNPAWVNDLLRTFRAAGGFEVIDQRHAQRQQQHNPPPRPPKGGPDTWADHLYRAVGPARVDPVHRALTKVLHPDTPTGDTTLMQQLNAARDRQVTA